ncbi:MAG: hypothetical protein FJZ89_14125 [Chloroflexi bacterium]|nr:hypothetical protein [Chloroflexota bacterium]
MEVYHRDPIPQSPAFQNLGQFVREHAQQWAQGTPDLEQFERELHEHVMALERELVAEELARYDVTAEQVEVEGVTYRHTLTSPETYLSAAGPVTVTRHLYRPAGRGSKSICPLELRAGIIGGHFTPRAARQAAFVTAQLTPGESEALFDELEGMRPSRASLDRLPKTLSAQWENHRQEWESALRTQETVPAEATMMAVSVDGVMIPMKDGTADRTAKQAEPGKHASGPTGNQEVGCGTVVLYDAEGERVETVRYGRMPESKKVTLQQQLQAEVASIVTLRPDLRRIYLADGAKDNWRLLNEIEQTLNVPAQPCVNIVDFYHACEHLKKGCDAAWGESTPRGKAEFERLKTLLKEAEQGTDQVIRALKYQRGRARGSKRQRLDAELTYFRNQRPHMDYAEYLCQGLPIASGVIEAACKTLVTQRMKRSGMAWRQPGGQGILTLRSLIQSDRWRAAWTLLSADFRKAVVTPQAQNIVGLAVHTVFDAFDLPGAISDTVDFTELPLAV